MRLLTMRSLPFFLPIWIFWLCRRFLTTEQQLDCNASCTVIFHTCWVTLGSMGGKAVQVSNSWIVGWCLPAAIQFWMHDMSATPTAEGRMLWRQKELYLPRSVYIVLHFLVVCTAVCLQLYDCWPRKYWACDCQEVMSLVASIVMVLVLLSQKKEVMCHPAFVCLCIFVSKITEKLWAELKKKKKK